MVGAAMEAAASTAEAALVAGEAWMEAAEMTGVAATAREAADVPLRCPTLNAPLASGCP